MSSKFLSTILLASTFIAGSVQAQIETDASKSDKTLGTVKSPATQSFKIQEGSRYMVNSILPLDIVSQTKADGRSEELGQEQKSVALVPNMEFDILSVSDDGKFARIGLDVEENSDLPSDALVSVEQLSKGKLSMIEVVEDQETDDLNLRSEGMFAARKKRGGMTYCFRDVKSTLLKKKICNHYASGVRAEEGYRILQRECGMTPAGTNYASLPINAVCVSRGGRPCGGGKSCGHIAIKVGPGTWFGAGTRGTPFLGNSRKPGYKPRSAIGCLVP